MPRRNKTIPYNPRTPGGSHTDKRRFHTKREALEAAAYQMNLKPGVQLRAYKCLACGGWHLTSAENFDIVE